MIQLSHIHEFSSIGFKGYIFPLTGTTFHIIFLLADTIISFILHFIDDSGLNAVVFIVIYAPVKPKFIFTPKNVMNIVCYFYCSANVPFTS